jgi:molybdate transport system substrate-binding protein
MKGRRLARAALMACVVLAWAPSMALSDVVAVGASADFAQPMNDLKAAFEAKGQHKLEVATASTGKLFAQINSGAPFDILLAADGETPAKLIEAGAAVGSSRFTYAIGQLALWSPKKRRIGPDGAAVLTTAKYRHLAIADPDFSPYGRAAQEVLDKLEIWERIQDKLIAGENIAQSQELTEAGKAEIGFVALSSIIKREDNRKGSAWIVPSELYTPLRQDAVLLSRAETNPAAQAFLAFLKSAEARDIIAGYGYRFD